MPAGLLARLPENAAPPSCRQPCATLRCTHTALLVRAREAPGPTILLAAPAPSAAGRAFLIAARASVPLGLRPSLLRWLCRLPGLQSCVACCTVLQAELMSIWCKCGGGMHVQQAQRIRELDSKGELNFGEDIFTLGKDQAGAWLRPRFCMGLGLPRRCASFCLGCGCVLLYPAAALCSCTAGTSELQHSRASPHLVHLCMRMAFRRAVPTAPLHRPCTLPPRQLPAVPTAGRCSSGGSAG